MIRGKRLVIGARMDERLSNLISEKLARSARKIYSYEKVQLGTDWSQKCDKLSRFAFARAPLALGGEAGALTYVTFRVITMALSVRQTQGCCVLEKKKENRS